MAKSEILHIHHASLNGRDNADDARNDSELMFSRDADVVTTTEMGAEPQRGAYLDAARKHGYRSLTGRGGQAIAVKKGIKVITSGYTQVIDDPTGPVRGHRDLPWMQIEYAGRKVTICSTHWVDDYETDAARRDQWIRQTNAVIDRMSKATSNDNNVGFFTGDVNIHFDQSGPMVRQARQQFSGGGLKMVWDELNTYPDTGPHGGTIDVIGRKGGSRFTEPIRTAVYTSAMVTSDHNPISAWYRIDKIDDEAGGGGGGGGAGDNGPQSPYNPPPAPPPPIELPHSGKGRASLAGVPFRLNPTSINWTFDAKVADIATVGGKVVQVLGTKISDITVSGTFGAGGWQEQVEFLAWIKELADRQTSNLPPVHFRYPAYGWDIPVYIKAYRTPDGGRSIVLDNNIIAPRWDLVLFVAESSATLDRVAADAFIARLSKGIGWRQTKYNGPLSNLHLSEVLGGMSVEQYLEQQYGIGAVTTGNIDTEVDENGQVVEPGPTAAIPTEGLKKKAYDAMITKGWDDSHWGSLDALVTHESGWNPTAQNPTSTAYGLFQFLDATWAGVGGSKTSDPDLQIEYGLRYVKNRYGSPKGAWSFWQDHHWY